MRIPFGHRESFVSEQFRNISEWHSRLAQAAGKRVSAVMPAEMFDARRAHGRHEPVRVVACVGTSADSAERFADGAAYILFKGQTARQASYYLPGGAQAMYDEANGGLILYRHADYLGSVRANSTPSRTFSYTQAYAPFGEPYAQSSVNIGTFAGLSNTFSLDLYDTPNREYSDMGRWSSPDPAGLAVTDFTDPQSWNRFSYVLNNPTNLIDPLGLDGISCVTTSGPNGKEQGICVSGVANAPGASGTSGTSGSFYFGGGAHRRIVQIGPLDGGGTDTDVLNPLKAAISCTAQHFGLTAAAGGTGLLGAPVSKAALGVAPGMAGASESTSVAGAVGFKIFGAAEPRMGVRILGTTRLFGAIGRFAPFVSAAIAVVDAHMIGSCIDQKTGSVPPSPRIF